MIFNEFMLRARTRNDPRIMGTEPDADNAIFGHDTLLMDQEEKRYFIGLNNRLLA
jgi:hypothetical protein